MEELLIYVWALGCTAIILLLIIGFGEWVAHLFASQLDGDEE